MSGHQWSPLASGNRGQKWRLFRFLPHSKHLHNLIPQMIGGQVEVGVHMGLGHRKAAKAIEVGGVGVVVEGAGYEHVEAAAGRLLADHTAPIRQVVFQDLPVCRGDIKVGRGPQCLKPYLP